jgi:hypothetical protein
MPPIGHSHRKSGDHKLSQVWYQRALKSDPGHVPTWHHCGLWQIERGDRDRALYHLSRIGAIRGTDCAELRLRWSNGRAPDSFIGA